ncbi:hypothetical protein ACFO0A_02910 [Novosphingobium tardum]|uniref:Trimeric autotransporter adhesin YadA-like head domain-containing protein n=1 Tax=Novosphingobium tardum TaxID=1538021 RepID=A0ABV8RKU7_9SPHN
MSFLPKAYSASPECNPVAGTSLCSTTEGVVIVGNLEVDASIFNETDLPDDAVVVTSGSGHLDRGVVINGTGNSLSALDVTKDTFSGSFARFVGPDGRPITQVGSGGQIETVAWVTISGVVSEAGPNRTFLPPTDRPYMLGVWSDVYGPTAVFRSNQYGGPTGDSWPISVISGAGREKLRIDDGGNILLGDVSGNTVTGERLQLSLGRRGDTGLLLRANAGGAPAHFLVESGGWYGALNEVGEEVQILRLGGSSIKLGNGSGSIDLLSDSVRLQGSLVLGAVGGSVAGQAGSIGYCRDCGPGGAVLYSDGSKWVQLGGNTPAGLAAVATGPGVVAAQAAGTAAIAVGSAASAANEHALALGSNANASGYGASAVGMDSQSTGYQSAAMGVLARALGDRSVAIGRAAAASGNQSTALGALANASAANATAVGGEAKANAAGAAAIGARAAASGINSAALGSYTRADQAGSTALGAGAVTTAANQVTLGGAGSSVRLGDLAASTAAQAGPTYAVTVDAQGTLGRQQVITTASLNRVQTELVSALAVTDQQFADLSGRVDLLGGRLDAMEKDARGGIAAAMALGGTMVVPDSSVSLSFNVATYRGQQGFSGALVARVSRKVYVSSGFAGSTAERSTGGRVGLAIGF